MMSATIFKKFTMTCKMFVVTYDMSAVICKMLATRFKMSTVGSKGSMTNENKSTVRYLLASAYCSERSDSFTGSQLRESLSRWLSPPNPSTNHNNACKAHHSGTAQWFFQGSIFKQWKSTGSFLWVHGKRALLSVPAKHKLLTIFQFCSGIWQKYTLVCPSSTFSVIVKLT